MLNALIGIVIIIIIIYIAIVFYQKHFLKLAVKMQNEVEHFTNLKIADDLEQVKQIGLIGDSLANINEAEKQFNNIVKNELPQLSLIVDDVKKSAKGINFLKTRDESDEAQMLLEKIATDLDKIQATIDKTAKLEKEHRAAVSDLEERYKRLRKILLTKNSEFGPALDALEEQLSSIEETFDDFSKLTQQGDHANAEKILVDLNKATINLESSISAIPVLYQMNHIKFDNQINEISKAYQQMRSEGFAFNDDDFEISLKELRQSVNDNITNLGHLDVQFVQDQDDEITKRINDLYDKMEAQIKARKEVDKSIKKMGKFIEHAYYQNQTLANELEQLSHNYSLEHNEIEITKQLGAKINEIGKQHEADLNAINDNNAIYTRIANNLNHFKNELTKIEKKQMALNDSISEFSAEEKKAHQILSDLNAELHVIQRKIENLNLPGISDDYVDYFGIVADEINHLSSTMNKVKISMDDVQKQLEQIKTDRDTLQEKTDDLIDQSVLAEQVMQYANRYVGKTPEIDLAFEKAKDLFDHKFNYGDSLATIATAVDKIEPGAYKRIEDRYYANKAKTTKK
ncbi:septation ring formation regulator EzrA [Fructilactobacillus frigidiflavus]|uniref:septation ring formation regulator EzrA n=1 Tax=Fructilactobacillus frigidiflavus TaxID=3242688 RepID=UPI0037581A6C